AEQIPLPARWAAPAMQTIIRVADSMYWAIPEKMVNRRLKPSRSKDARSQLQSGKERRILAAG
ncbi:hypothetical protein, partial [Chromobacterium haemolyticum]|uniref:hypothetical protein n=1 Tax=Chromobacterium haemolyticum TaxID=394935 RepID=UPI001EE63D4C